MTFSLNKEGPPLVLIVSHGGKKYKKQIGISVRPADFKKQRTKDESVNERLRRIENRLNERLNQFSSEEDILAAIDYALSAKKGGGEPPARKKRGLSDRSSGISSPNWRAGTLRHARTGCSPTSGLERLPGTFPDSTR